MIIAPAGFDVDGGAGPGAAFVLRQALAVAFGLVVRHPLIRGAFGPVVVGGGPISTHIGATLRPFGRNRTIAGMRLGLKNNEGEKVKAKPSFMFWYVV